MNVTTLPGLPGNPFANESHGMAWDFQLFAASSKKAFVVELSDPLITELSLVTKGFAPRNPDARALAMKAKANGGAVPLDDYEVVEIDGTITLKAKPKTFPDFPVERDEVKKGWRISVEVPDDVDDDGDGAEDYERILSMLVSTYYDISTATGLSSDTARAAALVSIVRSFKANLDDLYAGGDGMVAKAARAVKAGKTLSKATLEKIAAIRKTLDELAPPAPAADEDTPAEKAYAVGVDLTEVEKASMLMVESVVLPDAPVTPLGVMSTNVETPVHYEVLKAGTFADPGYQADKKKRYPLDTADHVRAAASYFGMPKNRKKYTASQQKAIDGRIEAAKKRNGIGDSDKATEIKKAIETQVATLKARGMKQADVQATFDMLGAVFPGVEKAALDSVIGAAFGREDLSSTIDVPEGFEVVEHLGAMVVRKKASPMLIDVPDGYEAVQKADGSGWEVRKKAGVVPANLTLPDDMEAVVGADGRVTVKAKATPVTPPTVPFTVPTGYTAKAGPRADTYALVGSGAFVVPDGWEATVEGGEYVLAKKAAPTSQQPTTVDVEAIVAKAAQTAGAAVLASIQPIIDRSAALESVVKAAGLEASQPTAGGGAASLQLDGTFQSPTPVVQKAGPDDNDHSQLAELARTSPLAAAVYAELQKSPT